MVYQIKNRGHVKIYDRKSWLKFLVARWILIRMNNWYKWTVWNASIAFDQSRHPEVRSDSPLENAENTSR